MWLAARRRAAVRTLGKVERRAILKGKGEVLQFVLRQMTCGACITAYMRHTRNSSKSSAMLMFQFVARSLIGCSKCTNLLSSAVAMVCVLKPTVTDVCNVMIDTQLR